MGGCSSLMGQVSDPPCLVIDKLYLGSLVSTQNATLLHSLGIRKIVNCSNMKPYHPTQFTFFDVDIPDMEDAPIEKYFAPAIKFIDDAINAGDGVLVHCHAGISRSTTIVLAYLIHIHHTPLIHAFFFTKQHRHIASPNAGFMECLVRLEASLFGGMITIDPAYYRMERYGEIEDMFDARMIDDIGDDDDVSMVPTLNKDSKKNFIQQRMARIPITQFKTRRPGVDPGLDTSGSTERPPATLKTLKLLRNGKKSAIEQRQRLASLQIQQRQEELLMQAQLEWQKQQDLDAAELGMPPLQHHDHLDDTQHDHPKEPDHETIQPVHNNTFERSDSDLITGEIKTSPSPSPLPPTRRSLSRHKYEETPIFHERTRPQTSSISVQQPTRRLSNDHHPHHDSLTAPMSSSASIPGSLTESENCSPTHDPRSIDVYVSQTLRT